MLADVSIPETSGTNLTFETSFLKTFSCWAKQFSKNYIELVISFLKVVLVYFTF